MSTRQILKRVEKLEMIRLRSDGIITITLEELCRSMWQIALHLLLVGGQLPQLFVAPVTILRSSRTG